MIQFAPTDDERQLQELVREFGQRHLRPALREAEAARAAPAPVAGEYHELGMTSLGIPEHAGGLGLGLIAQVLVWEELAAGDLGLALALPGPGAALPFLATMATPAQQQRFLSPFAGPEGARRRAALALFEPSGEGGLDALATVARADGDGYVLNGVKAFVTPAPAELYVVVARLEDLAGPAPSGTPRLAAFAVPGDVPGIGVSAPVDKVGLETVPTAHVTLRDCRVNGDHLLALDAPTRTHLQWVPGGYSGALGRALDAVRILAAAQFVGLARAAQEYAAEYATQRKAFGQHIAQFQAIAFLAADMATEVHAARAMTWRAAWLWDTGGDARTAAAQALVQAARAGMFCTDNGVQILGGHGYVDDHPAEKWMRDAKAHMVLNPGGSEDAANGDLAAWGVVGAREAR